MVKLKPHESAAAQAAEELHRQLEDLGLPPRIPVTSFPVHWLYEGEQRLDAGYYGEDVKAAARLVEDCRHGHAPLGETAAKLFYPGRFKRIYAKDRSMGVPFLTASAMLHFRPASKVFLSKLSRALDECRVVPNQILVTRSGTVGRCVIAGSYLSQFAVSDDAIRIEVRDLLSGYVYAFLTSWVGQTLLSKDKYGSAIKHLEPHHIAGVEIPFLPEREQREIHDQIMAAYRLRDEANVLLDEADEMLHGAWRLPRFDDSCVPFLPPPPPESSEKPEVPHPRAFTIKTSELEERFDASFHLPVAKTAVKILREGRFPLIRLGRMAGRVYIPPRFKRIYVAPEYGVPFLQGSHIPQMRPYDLKYISRTMTKGLSRWIIREGTVLVTCSGTIGRVGIVSPYQDGWAASQHLLRIIPAHDGGHPGYIAAFLMTEYGQHQLTSKIYGGVVDELTESDTEAVWIPDAPTRVQAEIGQRVVAAFGKRDEAASIEEQAVKQLEATLEDAAH